MPIPVNDLGRHVAGLRPAIETALTRVARSGWYVMGRELAAFEEAFAAYCGARFAVGVGNGTDALELALRAVDVAPGDRVVTVANAGMYATTAILAVGAIPVFADIEPETMLVSLESLAAALQRRPRAIVVTHLYGRMADMERIGAMARGAGIAVVEDCAQAHGALRDGRRAGTFGDVGCHSFYPTKNLGAMGDGGALVTNDVTRAERLRALRQYGWSAKYEAAIAGGRNSRLDEMQAAVLAVELPHLDGWNAKRRAIARTYSERIAHPAIVAAPIGSTEYVAHLYVVRASQRDSLRTQLLAHGVGCDVHYPVPDHRQPAYRHLFQDVSLPETERAADQVLTLPCFPEMADDEVERVIEACNGWRP